MTLQQLLAAKKILLADGASGTNYFNMGLQAGDAPELWNETAPEKIKQLHQQFIDAGADIILTNSFGGNARRLKLHNAADKVFEINKQAAELAKQCAGDDVLVAGSVGPTGDLFAPLGELTSEMAVDVFTEQMRGLQAGGADIIWIETMSATEEMQAACLAAQNLNIEYVLTASFDTAGRTMMGVQPSQLFEITNSPTPPVAPPVAIGANCGVGATDLLFSLADMVKENSNSILIAKANCGVPTISGDEVIYGGTPDLMADYVKLAIDIGAKIIGGCCGTTPAHLAAMRAAIDSHVPSAVPTPDEIVAKTGELVNKIANKKARRTRRSG